MRGVPHHGGLEEASAVLSVRPCQDKVPAAGRTCQGELHCLPCERRLPTASPVAKCMDCHKDGHKGQFAGRPEKGECGECHKVEGWKPSLFWVKEQGRLKYPLEG